MDHLWHHPPLEFLLALLAILPQCVWVVLHKNAGSHGQGTLLSRVWNNPAQQCPHTQTLQVKLCPPLAIAPPSSLIQALITKTSLQPPHSRTLTHLLAGQHYPPYTPAADCPPYSKVHHLTSGAEVCSTQAKLRVGGHHLQCTSQYSFILRRSLAFWGCFYFRMFLPLEKHGTIS